MCGIVAEIIDLKYLYLEPTVTILQHIIGPSSNFVKDSIVRNITIYLILSELNKFGARFKYGKFQKVIDDGHESITSNITTGDEKRHGSHFSISLERRFVLVIVSTCK